MFCDFLALEVSRGVEALQVGLEALPAVCGPLPLLALAANTLE